MKPIFETFDQSVKEIINTTPYIVSFNTHFTEKRILRTKRNRIPTWYQNQLQMFSPSNCRKNRKQITWVRRIGIPQSRTTI